MIKQIETIEIIFENCERIIIPSNAIEYFGISEVITSVTAEGEEFIAKDFILSLKANEEQSIVTGFFSECKPFARFVHDDVTHIIVTDIHGKSKAYLVEWLDDDFYGNNQKTDYQDQIDFTMNEENPVFIAFHQSDNKAFKNTIEYYNMFYGVNGGKK